MSQRRFGRVRVIGNGVAFYFERLEMTSITEKVILDQFPYLTSALGQPLTVLPMKPVVFLGCGTSYFLAQALAATANALGRRAIAVPAAEWVFRPGSYLPEPRDCVVVGLSRSGTTTETVQAIAASKAAGLSTVAVSCEADSEILRAADVAIYLETDPREGIVMTVSASLMLLAGLRMCGVAVTPAHIGGAKVALERIKGNAAAILNGRDHYVYLGGGANYGIANEAALKLQEMSLSYSQAFHPMEYRHGPISLIDDTSLVAILYAPETATEEALVARDIRTAGGHVIGIGGPGDLSVPVQPHDAAAGLVILPALQLLGEMVALKKNIDTETPRHLTKVVVLS
jgi:glucosamine--fructose-6-phosphate aminotransferase (isomerizing)